MSNINGSKPHLNIGTISNIDRTKFSEACGELYLELKRNSELRREFVGMLLENNSGKNSQNTIREHEKI